MFIGEAGLALRVSNLLALVTLFTGGCLLGHYAAAQPWRYGFALAAVGAALVTIIMALGG